MKRAIRFILVGLAVLLFCIPFQITAAQTSGAQVHITQVDNSKFPEITFYVSVTDANGNPLAVEAGQLRVSEAGKTIQPQQVSGSGDIGPLTTLLVMDVSGSMNNGGKLSAAKTAAQAYVEQMRPGDQAGLLVFNTKVTYTQPITTDHSALDQAINSLKAENDTALYDALVQANQILQDYSGRKAIILLTDGLDNQSKQTLAQVDEVLGSNSLSVSSIGLGNPDNAGPYFGLDETALQSLADNSGGVYSRADNAADLSSLYQKLGRALQSEYRITYLSPSKLRDGIARSLSVSLGGKSSTTAKYNPGGVIPEVANPLSWTIFFAILAALVLLLLLPSIITRIPPKKPSAAGVSGTAKPASRVKLH